MPARLFVISAPSGAGKSTLIRELRARLPGLGYSVSHTTRKPRGGESNGVAYHFVDEPTFRNMIATGEFVEWAKVYAHYYGTSVASIEDTRRQERDLLLDLDTEGAHNIRRRFPEAVLIFVLPPSLAALEQRLHARATDLQSVIVSRLQQAQEEISKCVDYDFLIINDELEQAVSELQAVVVAERCRTAQRLAGVRRRLGLKI